MSTTRQMHVANSKLSYKIALVNCLNLMWEPFIVLKCRQTKKWSENQAKTDATPVTLLYTTCSYVIATVVVRNVGGRS